VSATVCREASPTTSKYKASFGYCFDCGKYAKLHRHHLDGQHGKVEPDKVLYLCPACHRCRHSFPDNCWVGVTATDRNKVLHACEYLRDIKARVKFLSLEPLLDWVLGASISLQNEPEDAGINQLIIGAQTKPYKPPKIEWVEEIIGAADKAGIPVFCKDNLAPILHQLPQSCVAWTGYGEQTRRKLRQEMPTK